MDGVVVVGIATTAGGVGDWDLVVEKGEPASPGVVSVVPVAVVVGDVGMNGSLSLSFVFTFVAGPGLNIAGNECSFHLLSPSSKPIRPSTSAMQ